MRTFGCLLEVSFEPLSCGFPLLTEGQINDRKALPVLSRRHPFRSAVIGTIPPSALDLALRHTQRSVQILKA